MKKEPSSFTPQVDTGHYMGLCGICLGIIFLVQLEEGLWLPNLLCFTVGFAILFFKMRIGPLLFVIFVAGAQLALHASMNGFSGPSPDRVSIALTDVILCAALLGYVVSHYRLQSIWYHVLPTDVRLLSGSPRRVFPWIMKRVPMVEEKRSSTQVTPWEIAWLVVTLPVWAIIAQMSLALVPQDSSILGIPPHWFRILLFLWLLAVGFWVVHSFLQLWKHLRHDRFKAQLYLQDLLWQDTRGEQRRVNRWLAWWKLTRRPEENAKRNDHS